MALLFGTILVVAGFVCAVLSVVKLAKANPTAVLPLFAAAPSRPRASIVFNICATVFIVWGANIMTPEIGAWAFVLLIVAVLTPFITIRAWHNHQLAARG